jgi:rhamnulokinase
VRLICDSLGAGHANAVRTFEKLSGRKFSRILIVGGGAKNPLLCQATANAAGIPVVAMEIEGAAVGNVAAQLLALGVVRNVSTIRRHLGQQTTKRVYQPHLLK